MKYTTTLCTLVLSFFALSSSYAQYSLGTGDSLVLVPADYLAQLEAKVYTNEDADVPKGEEDLSHAFMDGEDRVALFNYAIAPMYFTDKLQLSLPSDDSFVMSIENEKGTVVLTHQSIFGDNQLNLSHLAPGVYNVILKSYMGKTEDTVIKL